MTSLTTSPHQGSRSFTTGDLARVLGVSLSTAQRIAKRGQLESFRATPTSPRRFRVADVFAYIAERVSAARSTEEEPRA